MSATHTTAGVSAKVSADDPNDTMGHRRGVAANISADDPLFPQPAGFYGEDGHYHLADNNSYHLSQAGSQQKKSSGALSPSGSQTNRKHGSYYNGGSALFSPKAESGGIRKPQFFSNSESAYSEGHFPRIQSMASQGTSLLDALSVYNKSASINSRTSPRVSALLSRVFTYEQVLEEMVDTMMGGEDGNGAKDWVTVVDLVSTVPAVCGERGTWDRMGLHYACSNGAPANVVEAFLSKFPRAAKIPCRWRGGGWLPLHCACVTRAPLEIVMLLLEAFPEATRVEDDAGRLALHRACEFRAPPECVAALLHYWPKAARALDAGRLGKHRREDLDMERRNEHERRKSAEKRKAERLRQLSQGDSKFTLISYSTPREPSLSEKSPPPPSKREDLSCVYPLALALDAVPMTTAPDWDVVMQLLQAYTEAPCKRKNADGSRALHRACQRGAPPEVVSAMVAAYPRAVRKPDNILGRLPLHWLASYNGIPRGIFGSVHDAWEVDVKEDGFNDSDSQVIRKKIRTEAPTEKEEAEIKMAALRGPKMVVNIINKKNNGSIIDSSDNCPSETKNIRKKVSKTEHQQNPLSNATLSLDFDTKTSPQESVREVVSILLEAYPEAARFTDKNGMYPLFLAFEEQQKSSYSSSDSFNTMTDNSIVLGNAQEMTATLVDCLTQAYPLAVELWRGIRDMREIVSVMGGDRFVNRKKNSIGVMELRIADLPCPPPLSDEIDWMTVKGLSFNCKEASNRKGPGGRTLLHFACANGAPVHVISSMLEQHPTSAGLTDRSRGWLPLHYAVACACSAANAARSMRKRHELSMQKVQETKRTEEVIESDKQENKLIDDAGVENLSENHAEAVKIRRKGKDDPLSVFKYYTRFAEETSVDIIQALLKVYPGAAKEKTGREGFLPLHLACEGQASLQVVALLLRAYRRGVKEKAKYSVGTLPLSLALKSGSNMALRPKNLTTESKKTSKNRPHNVKKRNKRSKGGVQDFSFAFHLASPLWTVVSLLLEAFPQAARQIVTKREAQYPIHIFCRLLAPISLIRRVLNIDPDSVRKEDRLGKIAMYYAVQSQAHISIMEILYDAYPQSAAVFAHPDLPFRIARWQASRPGMPVLARNASELQDVQQRKGMLPEKKITRTKIYEDQQFLTTAEHLRRRRQQRGKNFDEVMDTTEITGQRPNLTGNTNEFGSYMFDLSEKGKHVRSALDPVPGRIVRLNGNNFDHWDYKIKPWDSARGAGFPMRESMQFQHALKSEARPGFKVFKPDWTKIDREYEEAAWKRQVEDAGGLKFSPVKRLMPGNQKGRIPTGKDLNAAAEIGSVVASWYGAPYEWALGKSKEIKKTRYIQHVHNASVASLSSHDTLSTISTAEKAK